MLRQIVDCESLENSQVLMFILVKLQACSVEDCNSTINRLYHISFMEYHQKTSCLKKKNENSDIFSEIPPWWKVLFSKVAWLKSILAALLKTASIREVFLHGFCKTAFFGKFTARYLWRSFFSKVEVSNLQVPTLIKMKCFTKIYRTNDESNLHCVKDNVCIWMPLRCRDFQIALTE